MCELPLSEKYTLTVKEAAGYFNIGIKKMRRLAEDHVDSFWIYVNIVDRKNRNFYAIFLANASH